MTVSFEYEVRKDTPATVGGPTSPAYGYVNRHGAFALERELCVALYAFRLDEKFYHSDLRLASPIIVKRDDIEEDFKELCWCYKDVNDKFWLFFAQKDYPSPDVDFETYNIYYRMGDDRDLYLFDTDSYTTRWPLARDVGPTP